MIPTTTFPAHCDAGAVALHCYPVRPGVYRTEVIGLGGGLINELSRSYPTQRRALHAFDVAKAWFDAGMSIVEVLDMVALMNTPTPPPGGVDAQSRRSAGTPPCEDAA